MARLGKHLLAQRAYDAWWPIKATTCWCNKATLLGGPTRLHCLVAQQASIAMSRMQLDVLYSMCLTNASRHALSYLMSMLCLSYVYLMSYVSHTTRLHCNVAHVARLTHVAHVAHLTHVAHVAHLTHVAHVARLTHASRHVLFYVS